MMDPLERRLEELRGSLPLEEPGSRGLERFARNPGCDTLRALTLAGLTPTTVAETVYGEPTQEGQSPFAINAGNSFEKRLFANGAAALLELYRKAGRLTIAESKVVDLSELYPIYPGMKAAEKRRVLALRRSAMARFCQMKLAGDPKAPNIIVKGRLAVPLLGIEHGVEPDVLIASDSDLFYRPVEIKSYPHRHGKTDPSDLRSACRQAAVGVVALRHALTRLGRMDATALVPPITDLVLRVPGSYNATLEEMPVKREVYSLEQALNDAPDALVALDAMLPPGGRLDNREVLDQMPINYKSSCKEHCGMAATCKRRACAAGDLAIIGDNAKEVFAAAGSIPRVLELLRGQGAPPRTTEEVRLAERLRLMFAEYTEGLGYG